MRTRMICLGIIFFLCIRGETFIPDRNFNVKEIELCSALPLETPAYIPFPTKNQEIVEILRNLKPVIGFLPFSEQSVLFSSFNSNSDIIFDKTSYETKMDEKVNGQNSYINMQQISLSEMLSSNAKRFRVGLGCIMKISNYFQKNSSEDILLLENINSNNQDMLFASNQLNICERNFLKVLFNTLNKRKTLITEITKTNINTSQTPEYFSRNDKGIINGILYHKDDVEAIVNEFKNYATCHQGFNNVVHRKGIENIIIIGQMKKCLDEDKPNKNAGKSSREYKDPSITYINNKIIGINNADGIRTDRRTQNNYLLNNGYRFGKINVAIDNNDFPIIPIPVEWETKLNGGLAYANKIENDQLIGMIKSTLEHFELKRPFVDLAQFIIEMSVENSEQMIIQKFVYDRVQGGCTGNYYAIFNFNTTTNHSDLVNSELGGIQEELLKFNVSRVHQRIDFRNPQYDLNFIMESPYISLMCDNGIFKMYSEGTNKITGKVFDYYEGKNSFSAYNAEVSQSCFGTFTSGGKDDKDACRDSMNINCGSELDYRCKESGFYDVINQNPPAKTILPNECFGTINEDRMNNCFNWIRKHFIQGSLSIRPSAFVSYSLYAQNQANGGEFETPQYYNEPTTPDELVKLTNKIPDPNYDDDLFYVENNKEKTTTNTGILYLEIDRTVKIQINNGQFTTITKILLYGFFLIYLLF